jgi:hypothetical protein
VARRGRLRGSKNGPLTRKTGRLAKEKPTKVNTIIPADGIGVVVPSPPSSVTPRSVSYVETPPAAVKKAPRWKANPTYPEQIPDSNAYMPFKCCWIGCKASLHNMETLRKHIFKVHRDRCYDEDAKAYSCFWSDCDEFDAFRTMALWEQHVQSLHLDPLTRELGDGPTTHPAGKP